MNFPSLQESLLPENKKKSRIFNNVKIMKSIWENPDKIVEINNMNLFDDTFPELILDLSKAKTENELIIKLKCHMIKLKKDDKSHIDKIEHENKCLSELKSIYEKQVLDQKDVILQLKQQVATYSAINHELQTSINIKKNSIKRLQEKLTKYEQVKFYKVHNIQNSRTNKLTIEKGLIQCYHANNNAKYFKSISYTCPICYDNNKDIEHGFVGCNICSSMFCTDCITRNLQKSKPTHFLNMTCAVCRSTINHFILWKSDDTT